MPELRLHYHDGRRAFRRASTDPAWHPHKSGAIMLSPAFAGELFGPGQLLDASKYFIILPDAIGHGKSSKPSDGMRAKFPRYNYDDMVAAQYKLVTEGLNIRHVRLVLGFSMGGMQTWIWGITLSGLHGCPGSDGVAAHRNVKPQLDDAAPWSSMRSATIRIGRTVTTPRSRARSRWPMCSSASPPTAEHWHTRSWRPTRELADKLLDQRLMAPFTADANDFLYQWDSSRDYNPCARPGSDTGGPPGYQFRR